MLADKQSSIRIETVGAQTVCRVEGLWTVAALRNRREVDRRRHALAAVASGAQWDLTGIQSLDAVGALMLWHAWNQALPPGVRMSALSADVFDMLAQNRMAPAAPPARESLAGVRRIGDGWQTLWQHGMAMAVLLGQLTLDAWGFLSRPLWGPLREISAQIYHAGARALPITALVGFLIGVVLSYLSAQQLVMFGASVYIVDLLGIAVVRELGPVLAAILVAGRSGSAITAQIGVMRVTQELDAMNAMGISHGQRLVLPRVVALAIAMPLVVLWTDVMALLGGMVVAAVHLDLSPSWFVLSLQTVITPANFWIGLGKGVLFGILIALIACHFGLRIKPDTESLGQGTTASVVASITAVILADAICAIIFSEVGW